MDPFSAEGELLNIQNAFNQGQYQLVIDFDRSSLSAENLVSARVLQLRAQVAVGQAQEVLTSLEDEDDVPEFSAVKAFAQYTIGKCSSALRAVEGLVESASENAVVQVLGAAVLQAEEKTEEALALLTRHQGNLEAVALLVQIYIQQNRIDLALKEVQAARKWAQDSPLVNIAESWVGLRIGGEKYQQAFYVFEDLAQAHSTSTPKSLVAQAVAELHLGRLPEAEAALQQALQINSQDSEAIANSIVLNVILGKDTESFTTSLKAAAPKHLFLADLEQKSALFDQAASKYSDKVETKYSAKEATKYSAKLTG